MTKTIATSLLLLLSMTRLPAQDVSVSQNGLETTMSNGIISLTIGTNGRVKELRYHNSDNLIGSTGIYFDFTRKGVGNKPLSPSKAEIVSHTPDYAEVLYTNNSYHPQFKQGFILRKGVSGLYTYVMGYCDSQSSDQQVQEARVCTRLSEDFLYGYVDDQMQGMLPASSVIAACEANGKDNPAYVQDATYRLDDGSVYTKYDWAQYVVRDSVHGLMSDHLGVWNIHCSPEWYPGGPLKQELTVHATKVSPITIQMLQGEHFGTASLFLEDGESKIWGPVFIYLNEGSHEEMIADAKREAHDQEAAWPFAWFDNPLYPTERSTVTGRIQVTTGQRQDSIQVVLAQPDSHLFDQAKGYMYWALTDQDGNFSIKNVRMGDYALRAYATCGDVTDELQVKDIHIAESQEDLGDIAWTPTKYEHLLWQIGESNRMSDGFKLSDAPRAYGQWNKVPSTLTYTVGVSDPREDWWYAQTQKGTWTIAFDLDATYTGGAHLTASVAGSARTPTVKVAINGSNRASWSFGTNDAGIYRSAVLGGRHTVQTCTFPASLLRQGRNTITLNYNGSNGSGVMWDCIKLEAGDIVTAIVEAPEDSMSPQTTTYYDLNGRRIDNPERPGVYIWHRGHRSGKFVKR